MSAIWSGRSSRPRGIRRARSAFCACRSSETTKTGCRCLVSGDTLFAGATGRTDFEGGSMAEMAASMKKLAKLPDDVAVLPGHNDPTTIGAERRRVFARFGAR